MREIVFRGKTETGEWLYGSLERRDQVDRIGGYEITGPTTADPGGDTVWIYDNVIRETVGQFTGLKDKNGKDIFEGDIVFATVSAFGNFNHAFVKFANGEFKFYRPDGAPVFSVDTDYYSVIGNIHEHPELLI